jgi:hypothetical protein
VPLNLPMSGYQSSQPPHPTPATPVSSRRCVRHALIALGLALICFLLYFGIGRYYFVFDVNPNEILPDALFRHHTLTFVDYLDKAHAEQVYCFAVVGDHVVSFYPIVPGLLNVPAYLIARAAGVRWQTGSGRQLVAKATTSWVSAVSVACMYLVLLRLLPGRRGSGWALLFAGVYALATCVWPIGSQALWQHGPSLMFLNAALVCLVHPELRVFPLAGFFLGMAVWNRPTNALFAVPLGVYVLLHHHRRFAWFVAAAAPPVLAMSLYSQLYWGSVLALGQGLRSSGTFISYPYNFHAPFFAGLAGILVSPARGLFTFTPVFLLALPALAWFLFSPTDSLLRYLIIGALAQIGMVSKLSFWWGGHSFGYRYLMETVPTFTLLLAVTFCTWPRARRWRMLRHLTFWPLLAVSVYFQFLGAVYFPSGWNASPVNVDRAPERLWDFHDTELGRCQAHFLADVVGLPVPLTPPTSTPTWSPTRRPTSSSASSPPQRSCARRRWSCTTTPAAARSCAPPAATRSPSACRSRRPSRPTRRSSASCAGWAREAGG